VKIQLPQASANPETTEATVVVTLDASQQLHVNKRHIQADELQIAVAAEFDRLRRRDVILRAHRRLQYETVLQTLVELRQAGATEVHLAYEGEESAR
jgi:biopolymer transport protein ExbD